MAEMSWAARTRLLSLGEDVGADLTGVASGPIPAADEKVAQPPPPLGSAAAAQSSVAGAAARDPGCELPAPLPSLLLE